MDVCESSESYRLCFEVADEKMMVSIAVSGPTQCDNIVMKNVCFGAAHIHCEKLKYSCGSCTSPEREVTLINGGVQEIAMLMIVLMIEGQTIAALMMSKSKVE